MNREAHVRFCEGLGVQLPWPTQPFREDDCRIRDAIAARNFALLRKIAINLLTQDRSTKASLRGKRKKAAWDDNYMLQLLQTHFMR